MRKLSKHSFTLVYLVIFLLIAVIPADAKEIDDFSPILEAIAIQKITPSTPMGGELVSLSGHGFAERSQLLWDGLRLDSTFVSSTLLEFVAPKGDDCGAHIIQIQNPAYALGTLIFPIERSKIREITILCGPAAREIAPKFDMTSMQPLSGRAGTSVIVLGASFESPQTKIIFGTETIDSVVDHPSKLTFEVPNDARCGTHLVRLRTVLGVGLTQMANKIFSFEVLCHEPGSVINLPAAQLGEHDTNSDCTLSADEFIPIVDKWISALLANDVFFAAVDAWVSQTSICGLSGHSGDDVRMLATQLHSPSAIYFAAEQGAQRTAVEVFSLEGQPIFSSDQGRRGLMWNLRDSQGVLVPNGVYLYRATLMLGEREMISTKLKKLVVMR